MTEPGDKNTNWLRQCTGSDQCGPGLQCVCGACSSVCDRDEQCSALDPDAVCAAVAGPSCGATAPPICSMRCESSAGCADHGEGLVCSGGACMPDPLQGMSGASDAGAPAMDPAAPDATMTAPRADAGVASEVDPSLADAVSGACSPGYRCQARVAAPGDVRSFSVEDSELVAWVEFGTLDALGNHQLDGSIVRMPKTAGPTQRVHEGLDRPFRLWLQREAYHWLSGDPADLDAHRGMQTLYRASLDGSAASTVVRTERFDDLQVAGGSLAWLQPSSHESQGDGVNLRNASLAWTDGSSIDSFLPGEYILGAFDGSTAYLEHGGTDILRMGTSGAMEIISDPPVFLASADGDRLWVIHQDPGGAEWVSWTPSVGGAITHVARAGSYAGRIQPGTTVVWMVTIEPASSLFELWSIPKTGGEPERALSWETRESLPRESAPAPVWSADGDDAWVFGHGTVVHVRRPASP